MIELFLIVLFLSFSGIVLTLALFGLYNAFANHISKRLWYFLFGLVIIREIVPFGIRLNVFNYTPIPSLVDNKANIFMVLALVWLLGFIVMLVTKIYKYNTYSVQLKANSIDFSSEQISRIYDVAKKNLRITRHIPLRYADITSPMLVGFFRPAIYFPIDNKCSSDLTIVFEHELLHYKRKDILLKWLSIMAVSVHWFNPLIFILKGQLEQLCELSCDECILASKSIEQKISYGNNIIKLLDKKAKVHKFAYRFSSGARITKNRLENIAESFQERKFSKKHSIIIIIIVLSLSTILGAYTAHVEERPSGSWLYVNGGNSVHK